MSKDRCVKIISYDTSTLADVYNFVCGQNFQVEKVDPEKFLAGQAGYGELWLNLVVHDMRLRQSVSEKMTEDSVSRFTFVHPTASVGSQCLSPGCVIYPNVTIYDSARLAMDVLVHSNSRISHNASIDSGTFIGGMVNICGSSAIGKYCTLSPNCLILDKISITNYCKIVAGSYVRKDIAEPGVYAASGPMSIKKLRIDATL